MGQPFVSIVIPVYKIKEQYLRKCIENCVNQTLGNIEIILVDDGSPDNCGDICDEYALLDNRVKVIHKENGGLAAARKSGLDSVSGETMMFLDGDDYLDRDCCEKVYKIYKDKSVQMVMFDQKLVYRSSIRPTPVSFMEAEEFRTNAECRELQARVLDFNGWMATATSKLIRVDFLRDKGFTTDFGLKQGVEGLVSNVVLFEEIESVYYIHEPFYNYVYIDDSITHTPNLENNILMIKGLEYMDRYGDNHPVIPKYRRNLLNRVLYAVITAAIQGCFNPANTMKYKDQIHWYCNFLKEPLIKKALKEADRIGLNRQRKIILFMIEKRLYRGLQFFSWLRKFQLSNR